MAIEIGTSPALATGTTTTVTTAAFSPPASSLLVAAVGAVSGTVPVVSGGGLTWTRRIQQSDSGGGYAEIWTAPCPSGGSGITASVALTSAEGFGQLGALKVDVVTGAHATSPIGQSGSGNTATNNATVTGYTSSAAGSRGWCSAIEATGPGTPSSTDDEFAWLLTLGGFFNYSGMAVRKASSTPAAGSSVTFNLDAAGTGGISWWWAALEILPAPERGPIRVVQSLSAVHRSTSW
ncbi:hypothetical protein HS041_22345 [Planomonospora sp. ID67723]|uniref:hypothetical protein n=1 Tax=Planomonospora sp. ID67723 TaxID=2738134 RepID=UPI0018C4300B|nr:hypothetical protein [Planomonospora sp. ID67723]MBG0830505.1 hypothetical protein [Planomonospora sp. ID67723]